MNQVLQQTTTTTAFIFAIFIGATAFSLVLRGLGGDHPDDVAVGLVAAVHAQFFIIIYRKN